MPFPCGHPYCNQFHDNTHGFCDKHRWSHIWRKLSSKVTSICYWLELILLLTIQAAAEIQSRILLLLILLSLLPATCIFLEESTGISIASICVTFLIVVVGSCFYTATRLDSMQQRVFKLALATEANYFQVLQPQADTSEHLIQVSTMLTNHSGGSAQELAQPEQDLKSKYVEARCQMIHFQRAVCDPLASMGLEVVANIKSVIELDEREGTADNILYFEVMCDGLQQVQHAWEMLQTLDVEIVSAHDFFAVASARRCCRIVVSLRGYLVTIFLLEKFLSFLESQRGIGDAANSLGLLDKTTVASWEASRRQGASEVPKSVFATTALLRLLALCVSLIIAIFIHNLGSGYYSHINEQGVFSPRLVAMALPFWACSAVLFWEFLRSCCVTLGDGSTGALKIRPRPTQVWYRKYLGVQGRHYAFKVAALQLITVVIQGLAKASLFGDIRDQRGSEALNSASVHCFMGLLLCNCIFPALVFACPNWVSSRVGAAVMDAFLDFGYLITSLWLYVGFATTDYFTSIFLETILNYASIYMCIAHILCVCRSLETADWASLFQVQHAEPMWGPLKRTLFSSAYACALVTFVGVMLGGSVLSAYLHSHEAGAGPCSPCTCSTIGPRSLLLERCPLRSGYFAYGAPPLALDLTKRNITEILPDAFLAGGVHSRVTSLSLRGNHLTDLPEGLFVDLLDQEFMTINSLDLGHNRLMALSPNVFVFQSRSSRKVRMGQLHLESNCLTTLPAGVFKGVSLNQLRLQNNNLTQLRAQTFSGLAFSENGILNMSQNKLQELHADTFHGLTFGHFGILDMSQNKLQELHADAFHGLTFGDYGILNMSQNPLQELHSDTFHGLTFGHFGILDMSQNQLQELHADAFHGLTFGDYGILDMSQNPLQELHSDTFHGLTFGDYGILNMSQNQLQELQAETFQNLTFGQNGILDMSQNMLQVLHAENFHGLTFGDYGILDMSQNQLQELHADTFRGLTFGDYGILNMSQNQLQELQAETFQNLTFGQNGILDMSQNMLQVLPPKVFYGLRSLRSLRLEGNRLRSLGDRPFYWLIRLEELNLEQNQLTELDEDVFISSYEYDHYGYHSLNQNLLELNLGGNRLTALPAGLFNSFTNLRTLQLQSNQLVRLPPKLFQTLGEIRWAFAEFPREFVMRVSYRTSETYQPQPQLPHQSHYNL